MSRVLLVDDSAVLRSIVRTYLMGMGLEFEFATSAEEAVERFEALAPELVITDFHMPGATGVDLARRLRLKAGRRGVKVVLISSDRELRTEELLRSGVIDAFLPKPLRLAELKKRLHAMVG